MSERYFTTFMSNFTSDIWVRFILFSCLFVVLFCFLLRQAFRSVVGFFCVRYICFANSFPLYIIQAILKRFTCLKFFSFPYWLSLTQLLMIKTHVDMNVCWHRNLSCWAMGADWHFISTSEYRYSKLRC